ncbi:MAG: patatin-like phospholipase PlpD [Calditrichia bacterium]
MKVIQFLLIFLLLINLHPYSAAAETENRPKVGLVLSGGGARGFAHIGFLKVLDSLQIPIDYIAGTSMGGIVGGLYSIGYRHQDLEEFATNLNWMEIFSDAPPRNRQPYFQKKDNGRYQLEFDLDGVKPVPPGGFIRGQKIIQLFSKMTFAYESLRNFDRLPIPFRCVAVDIATGQEVVLRSGSLAKALRATMSIPSVFSPVEWDNYLLVDGGVINNLPVDVVRRMGADIVIAVNVGTPMKKRNELKNLFDVMSQVISLSGLQKEQQNIEAADLVITPHLQGFSSADFDERKVPLIIEKGLQAAREALPRLLALQEKYSLYSPNTANETLAGADSSVLIHGIQITGNTTLPFSFVLKQFGLKTGEVVSDSLLKSRVSAMLNSGYFQRVDFELRPVIGNMVDIFLNIKEKTRPILHGVVITGNKNLPFSFINRLLGLQPGDPFDTEILDQRITEMYALGYFDQISYEVEPVNENSLRLILRVKERSLRKMQVGLKYDDYHQLVGVVAIKGTNVPFAGLRAEAEFMFGGENRFNYHLSYPSRSLDIPIYPFIHIQYKRLPVDYFDGKGIKLASYRDQSVSYGMGIGLMETHYWNAEVEFNREDMNIHPTIAIPDTSRFPIWKDKLWKLDIRFQLDWLDDVLLPRKGLLIKANYERSTKEWNSPISYTRTEVQVDLYKTHFKRHTLHFSGYYGDGSPSLPVYKYFIISDASRFVGYDYNQIGGHRVQTLGFCYRYEHRRDIFFKLAANVAIDLEGLNTSGELVQRDYLWGFGGGVKLLSPVGPLELMVSFGEKGTLLYDEYTTRVYFKAGYQF